jgi:hypothetical protein
MKTYSELIKLKDYADRLEYLLLYSQVGDPTFGRDRILNQTFYSSPEWKRFRRQIIIRDHGCDLAHEDFPVTQSTKLLIHHINPITIDDIQHRSARLMDPENVVCVTFETHQAIHFANKDLILMQNPIERIPNDTIPWR